MPLDDNSALELINQLQSEFDRLIDRLIRTPPKERRISDIRRVQQIRNEVEGLRRQILAPVANPDEDQPMFDASLKRRMDLLHHHVQSSLEGLTSENDPILTRWRTQYDSLEAKFLHALCITGDDTAAGKAQLQLLCAVRTERSLLFNEMVSEKKRMLDADSDFSSGSPSTPSPMKKKKPSFFERLTSPKDKPPPRGEEVVAIISWSSNRDDLLGLLNDLKVNIFHAIRQVCESHHLLDPEAEDEKNTKGESTSPPLPVKPRTITQDTVLVPLSAASLVSDADAPQCFKCQMVFTFFKRRHHCRICGGVYCGQCTSHNVTLDGSSLRVCDACYMVYQAQAVQKD